MDGLCPPVRWVSSITSCSNQPLLLLATNPPPTDGHTPTRFSQLNPPMYHHHRRMFMTRPVSMTNNCQQSGKVSARCPTTDLARPTRFAEHAWQSQIRVWFLLASLQLISFFPCQQNPPKKQGGVWSPQVWGADTTIKLPLLSIWSGGEMGEVSIFQGVNLGQRQAVISLGSHWHKLDKSGLLFKTRLKTN